MIIYPKNWRINYEKLCLSESSLGGFEIIDDLIVILYDVLRSMNVRHLAYSGGIDSTIILHVLSDIFKDVSTYTISCREDHPDVLFAREGNEIYKSDHHEFIIEPTHAESDEFIGDNAVRQLFELVAEFTEEIICCDGIDEFLCGYHRHKDLLEDTYKYFLTRLLPDHLIPLDKNSNNVKVYLPYLDERIININKDIPLYKKVDHKNRKKIIIEVAKRLGISKKFFNRHKYGFCDAFLMEDKVGNFQTQSKNR